MERAALELASAEVDVILQAGTAIAFFRGFGHDAELTGASRRRQGSKRLHRSRQLSKPCVSWELSSRRSPLHTSPTSTHVLWMCWKSPGSTVAAIKGWESREASIWAEWSPLKPIVWRSKSRGLRLEPTASWFLAAICGASKRLSRLKPIPACRSLQVIRQDCGKLYV